MIRDSFHRPRFPSFDEQFPVRWKCPKCGTEYRASDLENLEKLKAGHRCGPEED